MTYKEMEKVADDAVNSLLDLTGKLEPADDVENGQYISACSAGLAARLAAVDREVNPVVDIYQDAVRILVEETERCSTMNETLLAEVELKTLSTATKVSIARKALYTGEDREKVEDRIARETARLKLPLTTQYDEADEARKRAKIQWTTRCAKIEWATRSLWPINAPSACWPAFDAGSSSILIRPYNTRIPVPKYACGTEAIQAAQPRPTDPYLQEWKVYTAETIGTDTVIGAEHDPAANKRWRLDIAYEIDDGSLRFGRWRLDTAYELDDGSLRTWPAEGTHKYRNCKPAPARIKTARHTLKLKAEWAVDELYRLGVAAQVGKPHVWSQHSEYTMFEPDKTRLDSVIDSFRDQVAETVLEHERYGGNCEQSLQRGEELVYKLSVQVVCAAFEVAPSLKQVRHLPEPAGEDARRRMFKRDRITATEWATWGLWVDGDFRPTSTTTPLLVGDVPAELRLRVGGSSSRGGDFARRFRPQRSQGEQLAKRARTGQSCSTGASSSADPRAA